MNKKYPYISVLGTLFIIGVLHMIGVYMSFYWRVMYYDKVLHLLGGIWIAMLVLPIITIFWKEKIDLVSMMVLGVAAILFVGVAWEIFELAVGFTVITDIGYVFDTSTDLIMDLIGSFIGAYYIFKISMKSE